MVEQLLASLHFVGSEEAGLSESEAGAFRLEQVCLDGPAARLRSQELLASNSKMVDDRIAVRSLAGQSVDVLKGHARLLEIQGVEQWRVRQKVVLHSVGCWTVTWVLDTCD